VVDLLYEATLFGISADSDRDVDDRVEAAIAAKVYAPGDGVDPEANAPVRRLLAIRLERRA
jgi:hypothetical protein